MKKLIETKKIIFAVCILSIALFIFPVSSFGEGALVCPNEGEIEGLVFNFGSGLPVTLPELGEVTITNATVEASGSEMIVITLSGQYNYHAILWGGIEGSGKGIIYADTVEVGTLVFEFESATLDEHFDIFQVPNQIIPENCDDVLDVVVPDDVDLFFKVKEATLIEVCSGKGKSKKRKCNDVDERVSFDLMLKLKHQDLQFVMFKL